MKLDKLIERLQTIAEDNGGNISIRVRDYNGYFEPLRNIAFDPKLKVIRLEPARS